MAGVYLRHDTCLHSEYPGLIPPSAVISEVLCDPICDELPLGARDQRRLCHAPGNHKGWGSGRCAVLSVLHLLACTCSPLRLPAASEALR